MTTVNYEEVKKFSDLADEWWDPNGSFRTLHLMNAVRTDYVLQRISGLQLGSKTVRILDVGCGGGLLTEPLAKTGAKVTGIDASQSNIKVASIHAEQSSLDIDYRCCAVEDIKEEKFDVVLAMEIIEHVADIKLFLDALLSLLNKDGIVLLSTINRTYKSYFLAIVMAEYILRWLPKGTHNWHSFVKPSEISKVMLGGGLSLADLSGMKYNPLRRNWYLDNEVDVNYIMTFKK